jgi:hypothetical protein
VKKADNICAMGLRLLTEKGMSNLVNTSVRRSIIREGITNLSSELSQFHSSFFSLTKETRRTRVYFLDCIRRSSK